MYTQKFLAKEDCELDFPKEQIPGMRPKLRALIKRLHSEQYGATDVPGDSEEHTNELQVHTKSSRAPSEEVQEVIDNKIRLEQPDSKPLKNKSNNLEAVGTRHMNGMSTIPQSRRFTPEHRLTEQSEEEKAGSGPTSSKHFSVEIDNARRSRDPPSLMSSKSPEPTTDTKGKELTPHLSLGIQQNHSPYERDDYVLSDEQSPLLVQSTVSPNSPEP